MPIREWRLAPTLLETLDHLQVITTLPLQVGAVAGAGWWSGCQAGQVVLLSAYSVQVKVKTRSDKTR